MARDDTPSTPLEREALATWAEAAAARARHDEPPTAEELLDLHAGRLDPEHAERLRDRLAEDPELADLYLELIRADETVDPDAVEVDTAWTRLDRQLAARRAWPVVGLAAVLVVAFGLTLWRHVGLGRSVTVPNGYHRLDVPASGSTTRDARVPIPPDTEGLAFHVALDPPPTGRVEIRLLDAEDRVVFSGRPRAGPDGTLVAPVPAAAVPWGHTYRLVVAVDGEPRLVWILTPTVDS